MSSPTTPNPTVHATPDPDLQRRWDNIVHQSRMDEINSRRGTFDPAKPKFDISWLMRIIGVVWQRGQKAEGDVAAQLHTLKERIDTIEGAVLGKRK